jgi:hypothetical protein
MRRVLKAWKEAERILREHRVKRAPVKIREIASNYANVVERVLDPDVSGVLAPGGDNNWLILVNASHSETRQRFSMAHELGHLILHGYTAPHADRTFRFRDARSSEGSALEEIQANQFAAELLMPRELVLRAARANSLDHAPGDDAADASLQHLINDMAKEFQVSRQAMTIRLSSLFA